MSRSRSAKRAAALVASGVVAGALMLSTVGTAFAANPAVDLDQCRNGGLVTSGTQTFVQCKGNGSGNSGWVNGNAGAANAHYAEGESISYRARLSNIPTGSEITMIIGYDVVHSGHDALDYLTSTDRWQPPETNATDTPDVPTDTTGVSNTAAYADIPAPTTNIQVDKTKSLANGCQTSGSGSVQQPVTSFSSLPTAQRRMAFFGATPGTLTYVGPTPALLDKNGDEEQQMSVTFTPSVANPVISWGAHIASRLDWGCDGSIRSASGISGSPYHMRIKSLIIGGKTVSIGNQDRSLSAAAVIFFNPGITTTLSATTGKVGDQIHDGATLSNATSTAGGTVTYTVYSDSSCNTVYASGGTKSVTNGVVTDSDAVTFSAAGTYYWIASYSGDSNNAAVDSVCGDEVVTISKYSPTGSTAQTLLPNDTFTISGGSSPSGTVDFKLFGPGQTCGTSSSDIPVYSETGVTLTSGSASTSNTLTTVSTEGTYKWLVVYSGDTANNGVTSDCIEQFTIDNDTTTP